MRSEAIRCAQKHSEALRSTHLGLEQPERRREQLARRVDGHSVVLVDERRLGQRDARAAAYARLGRFEHRLQVLNWLVASLVPELRLITRSVRVDLCERRWEVFIVQIGRFGQGPKDGLLAQKVRADLLVDLENCSHAMHGSHVLGPLDVIGPEDGRQSEVIRGHQRSSEVIREIAPEDGREYRLTHFRESGGILALLLAILGASNLSHQHREHPERHLVLL